MAQGSGEHKRKKATAQLGDPVIPDKLYFRIGEVARLLSLPSYVLRFWESEFPHLHPKKGGTGQRLYRRRDVEIAIRIKRLLYDEGYTIPGARQLLKGEARQLPEADPPLEPLLTDTDPIAPMQKLRSELREIAGLLERPVPAAKRLSKSRPDRKGLHLTVRKLLTHSDDAPLFASQDDATPE